MQFVPISNYVLKFYLNVIVFKLSKCNHFSSPSMIMHMLPDGSKSDIIMLSNQTSTILLQCLSEILLTYVYKDLIVTSEQEQQWRASPS